MVDVIEADAPLTPASTVVSGMTNTPASGYSADEKKATPSAEEYINKYLDKIDSAKEYHKDAFERMRASILFGAGIHWDGQTANDQRYICDIVQNVIRQRVASLYAKNPTAVAKRRKRLDFAVWDEKLQSLQQAMAQPQDPYSMAVLQDVMQGARTREKLDGVSKTLEIMFHHQLQEQQPDFKRQMKQLVRRTETTGVGYVRLDFHRAMSVRPEITEKINDFATRLSQIEALQKEVVEGDIKPDDADAEKLRIAIQTLQEQQYALIHEGLQFSFPRSTAVIPSANCTQLEGFLGAEFVVEEFYMTCDEIERVYKIQMEGGDLFYPQDDSAYKIGASKMSKDKAGKGQGYYCVYLVYDLDTFSTFTICRGYKKYLAEPAAPVVTLKRFFPWFALTFNDREDEKCIFPHSTIHLMWHQQKEYNRAKEALRQHRIAMRPLYASATGALENEDKKNLSEHEAHHLIELQNMQEGQSVDALLQMVKKHPIDPNVYETTTTFEDVGRSVGLQAADLATTSGATATETSLAEDSRVSSISSNADDMDDFLSAMVREAGHVIMTMFSPETAKNIAGPGAVWPDFPGPDMMNDIYLEIEAGSSGRPNKAAKAAAIQRLYPLLVQLPGVNPEWLVKQTVDLIDDSVDLTDAYLAGLPSIMTLNRGAQQATGNPATDPAAQGGQGGMNQPGDQPTPTTGMGAPPSPEAGMPGATAMQDAPQRQGGIMGAIMGAFGR